MNKKKFLEEDPDLELLSEEGEDLFEHHRIKVDKGQELLRIDKFLQIRLAKISRNKIQIAIGAGNVLVNNKSVKSNYKVRPGDEIVVVFSSPARENELIPEEIPLEIIFEDEYLLVVNKPAGLVVHPGCGNYTGTLVNGLLHHLGYLPGNDTTDVRPGLVHRIDKNTSGLLVIAKEEMAKNILARQFFDRSIERLYTALVWGNPEQESGTITGNIGRHERFRKLMAVYPPDSEIGKHAVTHYRVLERFGYVTLVQCKLETGRTHQIRAHFSHIGHPVFNDDFYGGDRIVKGTIFSKYKQFVENCFGLLPAQALHAQTLGFIHPITEKEMHFESPLPEAFEILIAKWRGYFSSLREVTR